MSSLWCSLWCSLMILLVSLAPSRTQSPPRLTVTLRESYRLVPEVLASIRLCQFSGQPAPAITWTVDGTDVPSSAEAGGGVYYLPPDNGTLVIRRADSSNNGVYECTGRNALGSVSASTELIFISVSTPWYISWYMWFVYAIVFWALTIPIFIGWFFFQKKRAKVNLPPADGWIGN